MNLLILLAIPFFLFGVNSFLFKKKLSKKVIYILSFIGIYVTIIVNVLLVENQLKIDLKAFDLNGDGVFSGKEITNEQKIAMARVSNDTGRALAPITGLIKSFLICFFVYILDRIFIFFKQIIIKT